jgi:hypothetical protein
MMVGDGVFVEHAEAIDTGRGDRTSGPVWGAGEAGRNRFNHGEDALDRQGDDLGDGMPITFFRSWINSELLHRFEDA